MKNHFRKILNDNERQIFVDHHNIKILPTESVSFYRNVKASSRNLTRSMGGLEMLFGMAM